jgi:hypothetical protein
MKSFRTFLEESTRLCVFTFGRFQPPTIGHGVLFDSAAKLAGTGTYRIYASSRHDTDKNPLEYKSKIKWLRKMFPRHSRAVIDDPSLKDALQICTKLYDQGFDRVMMVVGSDRVDEFQTLLNKYNGIRTKTSYYNFLDTIQVVSGGLRDEDSTDVKGISSSKMRDAVRSGDFQTFLQGLPPGFDDSEKLFNEIKAGLQIEEQRASINISSTSSSREEVISGSLSVDTPVIVKGNRLGKISSIGPNFALITFPDLTSKKFFIQDIAKAI